MSGSINEDFLRNLIDSELARESDYEFSELDISSSDSEEDNVLLPDYSSSSDQIIEDEDTEDDDQRPKNYYRGKDETTKWSKTPGALTVRRRIHNIVTEAAGPKGASINVTTPQECWFCFISPEILQILVQCTNMKIQQTKQKYKEKSRTRDTNISEIKAVIGLLYLAGIFHSNRMNLDDLWQTDGTGVEIFRTVMSLQRFRFLLGVLRFDDVDTRAERRALDKMAPIREVFEKFVQNCTSNYSHTENVTIDEMLATFRGRCPFRQYMPKKPAKYGLKIFALADSKTYYISKMEVYTGIQPEGPYKVDNSSAEVVKRTVSHISGTGRNITLDNWFNSFPLAEDLLRNHKLTVVGTLRKNKREIPTEFVITKKRAPFTSMFGFQKNVTLTSYIPKKGKCVILYSTMHHDSSIDLNTGQQNNPEIITYYNKTKCGVDTVDQLSASYDTSRNSRRWPLTLFFTILNVAGINAFIIYTLKNIAQRKMKRRIFLKQIGLDLIADELNQREQNVHLNKSLKGAMKRRRMTEEPGQNIEPEENTKKRCSMCPRKKDRKTKTFCKNCQKFLCSEHIVPFCSECSIEQQA